MNIVLSSYYKKIIRNHLLLKLKLNKKSFIPEVISINFNVYLDPDNTKYLYFYNLCVLLWLITGKGLTVKSYNKNYEKKNIYLNIRLEKEEVYDFIDTFTTILLPVFQNYNMPLRLNKFDSVGNYNYQILYADPVFTAKNVIISWSGMNKINVVFFIKSKNKFHSFLLLQYFKFKWY